MIDPIKIAWDTGGMELRPDFFPVPMARTRKIFKLLLADESWTEEKIRELGDTLIELARKRRQQAIDAEWEAAQQARLAESIKPHKREKDTDVWRRYVQTRDSAKALSTNVKAYKREEQDCWKTRAVLYEMAGIEHE